MGCSTSVPVGSWISSAVNARVTFNTTTAQRNWLLRRTFPSTPLPTYEPTARDETGVNNLADAGTPEEGTQGEEDEELGAAVADAGNMAWAVDGVEEAAGGADTAVAEEGQRPVATYDFRQRPEPGAAGGAALGRYLTEQWRVDPAAGGLLSILTPVFPDNDTLGLLGNQLRSVEALFDTSSIAE
jgi:hypothetical protein